MMNFRADLGQRMREFAHRIGAPEFWRWWTAQLAPLVPSGLRAAFRRRILRPVLAFADDTAVLWVPRATNGTLAYAVAARVPLAGDPAAVQQAGRAMLDSLPKVPHGAGPATPRVVVALPPGQVLRKEIRLPAAVEQDLMQALGYDLDRHTPFKPDELTYDAAVVGRDASKGEIRVDWAAALRNVVADARRRAESFGATVVAITPDNPGSEGPAISGGSRLNLLPAAERPARSWLRRWRVWVPLSLVALVAAIAVVLPIWQKRTYVIALQQITDQARVQADAASALRTQLETVTGDFNYVLGKKYGFPSQVQVLDDVTKLLPDDTWLTQLEVKSAPKGKEPRRELLLRGESVNAGRLVSLLEDSKVFVEAAPRSPTTKIQPGPGEIFDLGAQLAPTPPPPPLQFASTAPDAANAPPAPAADGAPAAPVAAPATPAPAPDTAAAPVSPVVAPATPNAGAPAANSAPPPPQQPTAPPGMFVPGNIPPQPGSVAPPSGPSAPTVTVNGQTVVSGAVPASTPQAPGSKAP
jgi:general secretion pathway protein L